MRINNIHYADYTTLFELIYDKLQTLTNKLVEVCAKSGNENQHSLMQNHNKR